MASSPADGNAVEPAGRPRPSDPAAVERRRARWRAAAERCSDRGAASAMTGLLERPEPAGLLDAVFGHSPYLSDSLLAEPDVAVAFFDDGPEAVAERVMGELGTIGTGDRRRVMSGLRRGKRRLALVTALADLADLWPLDRVTGALSGFADRSLDLALRQTLHEAAAKRDLPDGIAGRPEESGVVVLAMGKLGAFELNYSSDIDLIVLFEPARLRPERDGGPMALAVRMVRTLTYLLSDVTREGYVFRTDLRLRPHPAGHPMALAVEDALDYYERHGQNWERAALIKTRTAAGDLAAGEAFLTGIRPFVWRRSLDFAAVQDVHAIKRQIDRHKGHGAVKLAGHDLKVGRGGIREIEFFVQTQQLILGGRNPELRAPGTRAALRALVDGRWLDRRTADELIESYAALRRAEHRLQMTEDKQTQRLPERPAELERFARFMGFDDVNGLDRHLRGHLLTVERHYAALFESSPGLGAGDSLVFTGTEDDPETLNTLANLGFAHPSAVSERIRRWHHGHVRATRSTRARELLTDLMPGLLDALARQSTPDDAFGRLDAFLGQLPSGVQLFSLFHANPTLLHMIADLMGTAPRLADELARHTALFEAMLSPDFFEAPPDEGALVAELQRQVREAQDFQDLLDRARRWAHGRQFQIGLGVLLGRLDGAAIGGHLSAIAEATLRLLLDRARATLAEAHGRIEGGSFVVLALGKLGSRELGLGSDLDLIFLHDGPADARSDGPRPLAIDEYHARLAQRLTGALTARTRQGRLYDIDTRLRPSGNAGPLVTRLAAFEAYQTRAETWEHQALTRARPTAGDAALAEQAVGVVRAVVTAPRDSSRVAARVAAMRRRVFKEHGTRDPWSVKHVRGGVVELEFLVQHLQLVHGARHPEIVKGGVRPVLEAAGEAGLLTPEDGQKLIEAARLYARVDAVLRLAVGVAFTTADLPLSLKAALVRAARFGTFGDEATSDAEAAVDFPKLEARLRASQAAVAAAFDRIVGAPA